MVRRLWLNRNRLIIMAVLLTLAFFFVPVSRADDPEVDTSPVSSPEELMACIENNSVKKIEFKQDIDCSNMGPIYLSKTVDLKGYKWIVDPLILDPETYNITGFGKVVGTVLMKQKIPLNGMTEAETIKSITFSDGDPADEYTCLDIQNGSLIFYARTIGNSSGKWKPVTVTSLVTESNHIYRPSKSGDGQNLFRVYSISYYYKDTKTGNWEQINPSEITPNDYTSGDGVLDLPAGTGSSVTPKEGYSFLGWSETKDPKVPFPKKIDTSNKSGDLSFYAVWAKDQGNGFGGGGRSGFSAGMLSSMLSSGDATMEATSETAATTQQSNSAVPNGTGSSRRRISTGKSKTVVNFNDDTSDEIDFEGKLNADAKADYTDRFLILGIGLVAIAAIGLIGLIRKKKS